MQTKFVIEVIVDFLDKGKLETTKTAVLRATAGLNAKVQLINDGQHPKVICYSEDFYAGQVDLEYLHEEMQEETAPTTKDQPSDEFLAALKGE